MSEWAFNPFTSKLDIAQLGDTEVTSVTNSDGTLTISPTTGAVVVSLAPAYQSINLAAYSSFGGF